MGPPVGWLARCEQARNLHEQDAPATANPADLGARATTGLAKLQPPVGDWRHLIGAAASASEWPPTTHTQRSDPALVANHFFSLRVFVSSVSFRSTFFASDRVHKIARAGFEGLTLLYRSRFLGERRRETSRKQYHRRLPDSGHAGTVWHPRFSRLEGSHQL